MKKLSAAQIKRAAAALPDWRLRGQILRRTYPFADFPAAIRFVRRVAVEAERAWHHPDMDVRWNQVTLALTTHDVGGLTRKDFTLAARFDRLAAPRVRRPGRNG